MSNHEQIFVRIPRVGPVKVEVSGHAGPGCTALTDSLVEALGETISDVKKPAYHREPEQEVSSERRAYNRH